MTDELVRMSTNTMTWGKNSYRMSSRDELIESIDQVVRGARGFNVSLEFHGKLVSYDTFLLGHSDPCDEFQL